MSHQHMQQLLNRLQQELQQQQLWQAEPPSAQALASTEPFAIDFLTLAQWLQFIFLPRMQAMLEANAPLPKMALSPYAEEVYKNELPQRLPLIELLREIDSV